jgi:ribosome-binding factor A
MSRDVKRATRVSGRIREELSLLLRGLRDPRIAGVLVSRVEVTDDLSFVRVYVRRDLGADEREQRQLVRALESASGKLRGELTRAVGLRSAPGLRFVYDEGLDAQSRVEEILREIAIEQPPAKK